MRAMQVADFGSPLERVDVPVPEPGSGQVRVGVQSAGVNFADILITRGLYQVKPPPPFSPGFEVAGAITAIGESVEGWAVGDRVLAFSLFGGYADEIVVEAHHVFPLPDAIGFDVGAALTITYGTAYHAIVDRGQLAAGDRLVVLGASGGVGLACVDLGKALGAEVIACVGSDWKAEIVRNEGAHHVINYTSEDVRQRVREITDGHGADLVFDPVGGDATDKALRYLAWRGRLLVVGFTSGRIPEIPANRLLLKGTAAVGVFWGSYADEEPEGTRRDFERIFDWVMEGTLTPRIHQRLPLTSAPQALEMLARREVVGKVVLEVG